MGHRFVDSLAVLLGLVRDSDRVFVKGTVTATGGCAIRGSGPPTSRAIWTGEVLVVDSCEIEIASADWLRHFFGKLDMSPDPSLGKARVVGFSVLDRIDDFVLRPRVLSWVGRWL